MKPGWMILLGSLLVLAGLANSLIGIRQPPSPFDIVDGIPVDAPVQKSIDLSSTNPVDKESPTVTDDKLEPAEAYLQPASSFVKEPDPPVGLVPDRLVISAIGVDTPIIPTKVKKIEFEGQTYYQWLAPNKPAVGWHDSSALLGLPGNTVLNGHHNEFGEVFKDLVNLHDGDLIEVYSGDQVFSYRVTLAMVLPESFKSLTIRLDNARWILPTEDERLTLITCWPPKSNTYRVIVVALPEN
jgi:LPXTG-site transpeptidase (sortase) family protein